MHSDKKDDILIIGAGNYSLSLKSIILSRACDMIPVGKEISTLSKYRGKGKAKNRKTRWD
jgi:hypothetical protein